MSLWTPEEREAYDLAFELGDADVCLNLVVEWFERLQGHIVELERTLQELHHSLDPNSRQNPKNVISLSEYLRR